MAIRVLEIIFFLYFASHIPITLFIDMQALLPKYVYPQMVSASVKKVDSSSTSTRRVCVFSWRQLHLRQLKDVLEWYSADFKDPMVTEPPEWFKSFVFCEALVQLPFFPIAAYAFFKGQSTHEEPVWMSALSTSTLRTAVGQMNLLVATQVPSLLWNCLSDLSSAEVGVNLTSAGCPQ